MSLQIDYRNFTNSKMFITLEKSQNFTGIMLDAFATLLCSKLCWHNWLKPTVEEEQGNAVFAAHIAVKPLHY